MVGIIYYRSSPGPIGSFVDGISLERYMVGLALRAERVNPRPGRVAGQIHPHRALFVENQREGTCFGVSSVVIDCQICCA